MFTDLIQHLTHIGSAILKYIVLMSRGVKHKPEIWNYMKFLGTYNLYRQCLIHFHQTNKGTLLVHPNNFVNIF